MRLHGGLALVVLMLAGCGGSPPWNVATTTAQEPRSSTAVPAEATFDRLEVPGTTVPAPGRIAEIATVVIHPVIRVLVQPGDSVVKDQPLIEMDADEPEAEVRAKRAEVQELIAAVDRLKAMPRAEERTEARARLESAQIDHQSHRSHLDRLTALRTHDAVSLRHYHEQKSSALRAEADERAAQARLDYLLKQPIEQEIAEAEARLAAAEGALDAAEAELSHYVIHAPIDGIVCWLDVAPGTVTRPGTKTWGEIVDPREMDVKVELTPQQLSRIDRAAAVEVVEAESGRSSQAAFVFAAPAANRQTGRIPVVVRISDAAEPWHCHLPVTVKFQQLPPGQQSSPAARTTAAVR